MSNLGAQLMRAREAQNKTRADVAGKTGILIHDLAALEHGSFDALPDDQTVAGFVKIYAEYLGFRPEEPVAEFWAERGVEPPSSPENAAAVEEPAPVESVASPEPSTAGARRFRWGWMLAGALAVVLVVSWFVTRNGPKSTTVAVEPEGTPVVESTPGLTEEVPADDPQPAGSAPAPSQVSADPAPTPPEPAATAPATTLQVTEYGVGRGVQERRLIGESDSFGSGGRVWFWTRVQGGSAGDEVFHVWTHEGREIATVELDIGNANWRTWSTKTMFGGSAGRWAVEARDASGRVLARSEFVCR